MKGTKCTCQKCGNRWVSKMLRSPIQCPKCKRKDWDGYHNSYGRLLNERVNYAGKHVCRCKLCGNEWVSHRPDPSICSNCKSTRWQVGNKPDEGVSCVCKVCGGEWVSRSAETVPKQCHKCKSTRWQVGNVVTGVPCKCILCGGSWMSRSAATVPRQCPKCKKTKWAGVDPFDPDGLLDAGRYDCMKCGNAWVSRIEGLPKICPSCKSNSWSDEALKAAWNEIEKPLMYNCVRRWFVGNDGKLVPHDADGYHQYSPKSGVCFYCGWNNNTHRQEGVNVAPRITAEEGERRKRQWELDHPGEKF